MARQPHLFRHSIARHLKSTGYQVEFIQRFLGHTSITTTMDTYGTLSLGEMQQIIAVKTGDYSLIGDAKTARGEFAVSPHTDRNGNLLRRCVFLG